MAKVDCSEIAQVISDIAMNLGSRTEVRTIDDIVTKMQKDLPKINRETVVESIVAANRSPKREISELSKRLTQIKNEARSETSLNKKIESLQKNLDEGTLPEPGRKPKEPTERIKQLRSIRDDLKRQIRQSDAAKKQRLKKQIEFLSERIKNNDISLPEKRVPKFMTKELEKLQFEREKLKSVINERINELKPRSVFERFVQEPANIFRTLKTIIDFSGLGRQGGIIVIANPFRPFRAKPGARGIERISTSTFAEMFRSAASEQNFFRAMNEIDSRVNAPMYDRAGLELTQVGGDINKQEEAFKSNFFHRLDRSGKAGKVLAFPVEASDRAFVITLDRLRADSFDVMIRSLSKNGEPTFEDARFIANYINVATGRGSLGKGKFGFERAATALNAHFFSPKLIASRFQFLTLQPVFSGGKGVSLRARAIVAKEVAKFYIGAATILTLAAMRNDVSVSFDRNSSDYLKIKIGNTRIDVLAGLQQVVVFANRTLTGKITSLKTGRTKKTRRIDTAVRFTRSKLAPVTGKAVDFLFFEGKNVVGETFTPAGHVADLLTPLTPKDIQEAIQDQGLKKGTAIGLTAVFGAGVQTFDVRKKRRKKIGFFK